MTQNRQQLANAIRILAVDAVQKANSGHPGMPMGMADIAEVLFRDHFKHNPKNPMWIDRDRFVLSNGHGSMLMYAVLHLLGYHVSIDDLKNFRQLHSNTPGHPEVGYTPGVETTTGPLGQGIANAVGFAIAEKVLANQFNKDNFKLVDHFTYVFLGDGCLMEGISHEVCSLAGTLGLGKLVVFYDDNGISIDGHVEGWFTDNTPKRFESYGWQVIPNVDGHNADAINQAILQAKANLNQPTLICCKTVIGKGSPNKSGSHDCHGAPLGNAEIEETRKALNWNYPPFEIPADIYDAWNATASGENLQTQWDQVFTSYKASFPELANEFQRRLDHQELPSNWQEVVDALLKSVKKESVATRKASQISIEAVGKYIPELLGGSADLASSNLTLWSGSTGVSKETGGNYLYYGVREFGMSAIMNGLALHGGFIPYGGTFAVFSDYARNAIRMSALMKARVIYVLTHDSIGLGEDGPTHQPVEHANSMRLIPNLDVWRPADTLETAIAWQVALESSTTPSALLLSRQNLPYLNAEDKIENIRKGAYVLSDFDSDPENILSRVILIATGSEVELALKAKAFAKEHNIADIRIVSMPSTSVFDRQSEEYKQAVLPKVCKKIAIEAGTTALWYKYVGLDGAVIGLDRFGESAPAGKLFEYFGFTVDNVISTIKTVI